MCYSRYSLSLLTATMIAGMAHTAMAQQPDPQTLNGQMQRIQRTQLPSSVPAGAYREWPGTPSMAKGPESDDDVIDSEGGGAIPSLPLEVQKSGSITYVTGGVGDEEVAQLKASEHNYNLHLLMSAPGGAFISDISIHITDASGTQVVAVDGAGPYFYALLAPGKYTVELSDGSESKKFSANIKDGGNIKKTVQFQEAGGVITPHTGTATVE